MNWFFSFSSYLRSNIQLSSLWLFSWTVIASLQHAMSMHLGDSNCQYLHIIVTSVKSGTLVSPWSPNLAVRRGCYTTFLLWPYMGTDVSWTQLARVSLSHCGWLWDRWPDQQLAVNMNKRPCWVSSLRLMSICGAPGYWSDLWRPHNGMDWSMELSRWHGSGVNVTPGPGA